MVKGFHAKVVSGTTAIEKLGLVLIIIYPLFYLRPGLDFTDTGFLLTNYQQMFNEPLSVESSFKMWLTNVLGGFWVYFWGDSLGLLGYRIAAVLLVYATVYICYLTLKPYFKARHLLWGSLVSVIFINRSGFQFSYNSLTALFYVLAAYFLIKGLMGGKNRVIVLSAFILGLNVFIRLPNIIGFLSVLAIFFAGCLNKTPFSVQIKQVLLFVMGFFLAGGLVFMVMALMGHLNSFYTGVLGTYAMLGDPQGHHYSDRLVEVMLKLYQRTGLTTAFTVAGLADLTVVLSLSARLNKRAIQYGIIIGLSGVWLYLYRDLWKDWYALVSFQYGVLLLITGFGMLNAKTADKGQRLTGFIALVILVLVPIGSANGFVNSVFGMYLAIPLVCGWILGRGEIRFNLRRSQGKTHKGYGLRLAPGEIGLIGTVVIGIFIFMAANSAWHFTYRDAAERGEMAYEVNHPMLKGVLTTADRARVVQELLDALPEFVKEDDYLLAYEQISLVYFLTKTRPYLYGAWPMLYDPGKFRYYLNKAQQERPYLPVIVRAKGSTEDFSWPNGQGLRINNYYLVSARAIMGDFISAKCYNVVWGNSFFEILVPENR